MSCVGFGGSRVNNACEGALMCARSYWETLRIGSELPHRQQIDPRKMVGALEHVFLAERVSSGIAKFRIAGAIFNDLLGMDVRGLPLSALLSTSSRASFGVALESVFVKPLVLTLALQGEQLVAGKKSSLARMQIMPVVSQVDEAAFALGVMECDVQEEYFNRCFRINNMYHERLHHASPAARPDAIEAAAPFTAEVIDMAAYPKSLRHRLAK